MISSLINQKLLIVVHQIFNFFQISNNKYFRRSSIDQLAKILLAKTQETFLSIYLNIFRNKLLIKLDFIVTSIDS